MKHLFWAMALLLCVGYSGSNSDDIYQLGDYYNRNGNKGVVIEISNGGRNGKILSLDETYCSWRDVEQWCRNHGDGWRLPTKDELLAIYTNKLDVNYWLKKYNSGTLKNSAYWSSSRYHGNVLYVLMDDGRTTDNFNIRNAYVRAVSAF